jgi:hypothetical protein
VAEGLREAAQALPDDDPRRARVLALLSNELAYAGEPARCRQLATEAIEIARTSGDPAILAYALPNAIEAIQAPDMLQERKRLSDELLELARRLDDPRLSALAGHGSVTVGMETGDRSRVESGLATERAVAASVRQPSLAYGRLLDEFLCACTQGDLRAAEQWALQGFELGRFATTRAAAESSSSRPFKPLGNRTVRSIARARRSP